VVLQKQPLQGDKGFLARLFDFSFEEFVTPTVITIVFVLMVAVSVLFMAGSLLSALSEGGATALVGLIMAPIGFLLWVLIARMWLELVAVIFRLAQLVENIERELRSRSA
jgi:hypothetical protein